MRRGGPTIFTRLTAGYLAVFVPVAALGVYAFTQLARFRSATDEILRMDRRAGALTEYLSAAILDQTRYEKKYLITSDNDLLARFSLMTREVTGRIDEGFASADSPRKKEMLLRIRDLYGGYITAFDEERSAGKGGDRLKASYGERKEAAVEAVLGTLRGLKVAAAEETRERIGKLEESAARLNSIAIATGGGLICAGIVISLIVTGSITRPLRRIRQKTRQVAGGDFGAPLAIDSPPEMRELADDFNGMCLRLNETDKMKSDFFSLMAHELRMPLASIREGTSLLLHGIGDADPGKGKEVLSIVAEESTHLIDLVNSLLDLSKMEAGMLTLNLAPCEPEPLIRDAVSMLTPLALAKGIEIRTEVAEPLSPVPLDGERIRQTLRNLIGNAVKFTPPGGRVVVSARTLPGSMEVAVHDTGPGIAASDLTLIFEKYQQSAITKYNKIKGTGMGLAIVRHIIEAHGGRVWAESEPGQGSTFTFSLPA